MKRIIIVGGPGSGKSSLAVRMGAATGLPVVHIDHIHWQPGWIERSSSQKDRLTREVHAKEEWIFEGGHYRTLDERLARADTFIWLDFSVWLRFWRVAKRTLRDLGNDRPDLPSNCPERINLETLKFAHFIWTTRNKHRERLAGICKSPPSGLSCYHFTDTQQIDAYVLSLKQE